MIWTVDDLYAQSASRLERHFDKPAPAVVPAGHGRGHVDGVDAGGGTDGHGGEVEVKELGAVGLVLGEAGEVAQNCGHVLGMVLVHVRKGARLGDGIDLEGIAGGRAGSGQRGRGGGARRGTGGDHVGRWGGR